ncbi:unnamed protein product [Paramecium octaurelia]|uniref:Hydroxymethylglutaryl-CoA synthase n=1 Tax=Paramecium octaurelia TaxID=43137 RepID=A0A8S1UEN9_PAROT|nr:unnamed protein product [Paramecium octaurelia]
MKATNVGIEAIEIYFPKTYVNQAELELFDNVSQGKYTVGLGQVNMAFVRPFEDVNTMALTVVTNLLEKYQINPALIGRLEVGTESLLDKSKSTKTTLMRLFGENTNIEGVTSINACYGGTNALFNTINWMQSEAWDGRLGLVVCTDIAVYAKGSARTTGGAGAVAMLIAPNATFTLEPIRTTYMKDNYDFYKPNFHSEYPTVDGQLSIQSYLSSIDNCIQSYFRKNNNVNADFYCFHSPFHKMVQKSFLRVKLNESFVQKVETGFTFQNFNEKQSQMLKFYQNDWLNKALPSCLLSRELGNIYTGALYAGLVSLIQTQDDLINKRIMMFSYGSGCAASLFFLRCNKSTGVLKQKLKLQERLQQRIRIPCIEYDHIMQQREINYNKNNQQYQPKQVDLYPGTFYLKSIDDKYRREYLVHKQFELNQTSDMIVVDNSKPINKIQQIRDQMTNNNSITDQSTQQSQKQYNQLWTGFYKKTIQQRLDQLEKTMNVNVEPFKDGGLSLQNANLMVENCIGKISYPLGLGLNFMINGQCYSVPMAIEEPSVIAAASAAAKTISEAGTGFQTYSSRPVMMGQIQLLDIQNFSKVECLIDSNRQTIINRGNQACQSMVKRGGGLEDVKCRNLGRGQGSVDIFVNVCDSMGANLVNTILEFVAPLIAEITGTRVGIKILTNLCTNRKVTCQFCLDIDKMNYKQLTGKEVAKLMMEAYQFAELDIYRAVTHNKGIINGIEAVCNAAGQDARAVNASLHGYASINGQYKPLSSYKIVDNKFIGELTVPISVGTQGGVLPQNPLYSQILSILDYPDSQKLAEIIVSVGLASNFAALRALAVEGIQKGHMTLHARNIAIASGIPEHLVDEAVLFMKNRNSFNKQTALEFLKAYNIFYEIGKAKGKQMKAFCTFSGSFDLIDTQEKVDLHVVFECDQNKINLNYADDSPINRQIFGLKGQEWLKNLFSVLNTVKINREAELYKSNNLTSKLKLLAILINLLSFNMLSLDFDRSKNFILNQKPCLGGAVSLKYGLSLMNELIHIFEYNIDQFIGFPELRQALMAELNNIILAHIKSFELLQQAKQGQFSCDEFLCTRQKRLSCTMMLLCDCISLKNFSPSIIEEIKLLGRVIEIQMTLTRDTQKWNKSTLSEPNVYTYWLIANQKLILGENREILASFYNEHNKLLLSLIQELEQKITPQLSHLKDQAMNAIQLFYKPRL